MAHSGNTASVVDAGIFWDIENIPIHCARADEEAKDAVTGMRKLVQTEHFQADANHNQQEKTIRKFVIVARMPGANKEPTPQHCKDRLVAHGVSITVQRKRKRHVENSRTLPMIKLVRMVELIDLPFSDAKDYCDDEIFRVADIYAKEYNGKNSNIVIYLMTGDKALIRRVSSIRVPFDLIVVILRGNRDLRNVTGHCRNVRKDIYNSSTGRRLQIYLYEEVIRAGKGASNDHPVNDVEIFRREGVNDIDPTANTNGRNRNSVNRAGRTSTAELDESHFDILFR